MDDRGNKLAFVGIGMNVEKVHRLLSYALLTDVEVRAGREYWRQRADPFAECFAANKEPESFSNERKV